MGDWDGPPPDFPFEADDYVAWFTASSDASAEWMAAQVVSVGSGGVMLRSHDGLALWVPWTRAVMRELADVERDAYDKAVRESARPADQE